MSMLDMLEVSEVCRLRCAWRISAALNIDRDVCTRLVGTLRSCIR